MESVVYKRADEQIVPLEEVSLKNKAKSLPERYFSFLDARSPDEKMAANLLTAQNLLAIKRYVNNVHGLPRTLEETEEEADYGAVGIKASRIHNLYEDLHLHVAQWSTLERKIKSLGPEIELFAEGMGKRGGRLIERLQESDVYQSIKDEWQGDEQELDDEQQQQLFAILEAGLTELRSEIEDTSRSIKEVDCLAEKFNKEIDLKLRPQLARVLKDIKSKENNADILTLEEERDQLDVRIGDLIKQYDANVGYAFAGLWWGPIGLVITGGIYGAEAEEIRHKKNKLIVESEALSQKISELRPALESVQTARDLIQNISTGTRDLKSAAQRLADVWLYLAKFSDLSVSEARSLTTLQSIDAFIEDFADVIKPWSKIQGICVKLSSLFDQLIEESEDDK